MRVEESDINLKWLKKIALSHGNYYFFDKYIIAEINSGVIFNWSLATEIIDAATDYYGEDVKNISYISNRVNTYSLKPLDWLTFFNNDYKLRKVAFVSYTRVGSSNVILEKLFIKTKLKKFTNLEDAIDWVLKE